MNDSETRNGIEGRDPKEPIREADHIDHSAKPVSAADTYDLASSYPVQRLLARQSNEDSFPNSFPNKFAAHNSGARDDVVDLMRTNLLLDWQAGLHHLASSQHSYPQQINGFPSQPTAGLSYLTANGKESKVISTLPRRAPFRREQPPSKKARLDLYVLVDRVLPLSAAERKASFPAPPIFGSARTLKIGEMTYFKEIWANFERLSDAMDDTKADQDAFVKEFFTRALYCYEPGHLCKKLQARVKDACLGKG